MYTLNQAIKKFILTPITFTFIFFNTHTLKAEYDTSVYMKKDLYDYKISISPYISGIFSNIYDIGLESSYQINKFWSIGFGLSYSNKDIDSLNTQIISAKEKTVDPIEYDIVNISKINNQSFFNFSFINNFIYQKFIFQFALQTSLNKPKIYTGQDIYIDYDKADGTLNEAGDPNTINVKTKYRNDAFFYTYNISFNLGYNIYKDLYGFFIYNITYDSYRIRRYIYTTQQGPDPEQTLNSYIARTKEEDTNFTNHYFGIKLLYSFNFNFK